MRALWTKNLAQMFKRRQQILKDKTEYALYYLGQDKILEKENFILEDALTNAKRWVENYKKDPRADWKQKEKISKEQDIFEKTLGIMGEYIVLACLHQLDIPPLYSDPKYPYGHPNKKPYDISLAEDFRIEIKTIAPRMDHRGVNVDGDANLSNFDHLLGVKLYHKNMEMLTKNQFLKANWNLEILENVEIARLEGWLTRKQVKESYDPRYKRYWQYLDNLNSMRDFWIKALTYSQDSDLRDYKFNLMAVSLGKKLWGKTF